MLLLSAFQAMHEQIYPFGAVPLCSAMGVATGQLLPCMRESRGLLDGLLGVGETHQNRPVVHMVHRFVPQLCSLHVRLKSDNTAAVTYL